MKHRNWVALGCLLALGLNAAGAFAEDHAHHHASTPTTHPVLAPPPSMQVEHQHLHEQLAVALKSGGETQEAAEQVEKVLTPHFIEEDRYAMPPLSLLAVLADGGKITPQQRQAAIAMSEKLREHYRQMRDEHVQITEALNKLIDAAKRENKPEQQAFAQSLRLHAQNEEEILYPATLLLGEYLKLTAPDATDGHGHKH